MKLKLSRGYRKYNKILAKIEKPEVDVYVRKNVPEFRNHKSQSYEIRNLAQYRLERVHMLLFEIGTPEVDLYMKDFSLFFIFSKTAHTIFKKINVLIKCHELLVVYKF